MNASTRDRVEWVPGLRRSEVAAWARVSVEYYAKLERGALAGASAGVLEAIVRVLRLDADLIPFARLDEFFKKSLA